MNRDRNQTIARLLIVLLCVCSIGRETVTVADAGSRTKVTVIVADALARSAQPVRIESRVFQEGLLFGARGVGGERVLLEVNGDEVASSLTGGDGRAYFEFEPRRLGLFPMRVILSDSPRVLDAIGTGTLAVWERRRPILLVEQSVLLDHDAGPSGMTAAGRVLGEPSSGAAEALSRLGKFYFNLVYLMPPAADRAADASEYHAWLEANGFPSGVVQQVPPTGAALEAFIGTLKEQGWENLKAGVGSSEAFAQALVAHRLKVAIRTDKPRADFPRRAKVVPDWTSVRKQLQD
ncbi:hypothetical protein YTPLAS18_14320 [Nitrospira sp.]|nr:hypothetical protein YTPLAS18_14320 [Nitrospira sp.]